MLNNQEMNSLAEKKEKVDFVSFSEVDENGNFREAYGYFEKKYPDTTGEKRQFVAPGGESNFSKMKVDKYLPIGTVVLLKDAKKRVMITGFAVKGKETGDKMYDYMGCMYPGMDLSAIFSLAASVASTPKTGM